MALSKIPTNMYTDPTAAKLPSGSVIKMFYDGAIDGFQQSGTIGVVLEATDGHRPSFVRVLGSTESQIFFDGDIHTYGDIDNDSHGYVSIQVRVKRTVNGSNQTTVYNEGGIIDRAGQTRMRGHRVRFIDNPTTNAGDTLEYLVEVALNNTTAGRYLNVNNSRPSSISIMEMKI